MWGRRTAPQRLAESAGFPDFVEAFYICFFQGILGPK